MLHEAGYRYTDDHTISSLTASEIRRLLEGQRVHNEIEEKLQEARHETGSMSGASGRTIPRASDRQALEEFEKQRGT